MQNCRFVLSICDCVVPVKNFHGGIIKASHQSYICPGTPVLGDILPMSLQ